MQLVRKIKKGSSSITGLGITLTNDEIKDIMKVHSFRSLLNREILLTRAARKVSSREGGFRNFLRLLMAADLPLMKNVLTPLVTCTFVPLGLTTVASATNEAIQEESFGSGTTSLIISNEEMNDTMKIVKSLEESSFQIKEGNETIKNEAKKQKGEFLVTLGTSLLRDTLEGKGRIRGGDGVMGDSEEVIRAGEEQYF